MDWTTMRWTAFADSCRHINEKAKKGAVKFYLPEANFVVCVELLPKVGLHRSLDPRPRCFLQRSRDQTHCVKSAEKFWICQLELGGCAIQASTQIITPPALSFHWKRVEIFLYLID